MSQTLTGRVRCRTEPRGFFGSAEPLVVLQVEYHDDDSFSRMPGNYWRDAKVTDLTSLNLNAAKAQP